MKSVPADPAHFYSNIWVALVLLDCRDVGS